MEEASTGSRSSFVASEENLDENILLEPMFETFVCPLTKQVMKDPVNTENGQTFERESIEKWFTECMNSGRKPVCPLTSKELQSTHVSPNLALKRTIQEWILRNELARLKNFCNSISPESSVREIMRVLKYIEDLQKKSEPHKNIVRKAEVIPMVTGFMRNASRSVRCRALEVLCILAKDDANKEALAYGDTIRTIVKFLYHELPQEREQAATLLYELSKSETLSEKIGDVNGAILILIGIASSTTENLQTVLKAENTLENLEKSENNVLRMAENGRLQPLLKLFLQGSPETQLSMTSRLGELPLSNDMKILVAQNAGPSLVDIMISENLVAKEKALRALNEISSHESSAKLLIEIGILPPLVEQLFAVGNKQLPTRLKAFSATILANLVASSADFESIVLDKGSKTLVSEDFIYNLLHLISNSGPAVGSKLLQLLVGLTSSPTAIQHVVASINRSGGTTSLIQFMEVPTKEIRLEAIKVLRNISPFMSNELANALCGSAGLSKLIEIVTEDNEITEEKAVAIGLLAELPNDDPGLIQCFLQDANFNTLLQKLLQIHRGKVLGSRFSTRYFEGLVRIIAKLTYVPESPPSIAFAHDNDLAALFADLLQTNGLDNVQVVSAKALRNLSHQTRNLSRVPEPPPPSFCGILCPRRAKKPEITGLCKVHGGVCSLKGTFCIINGGVVDKLVACLDHENEKVVEAAFVALCTILEDGVNIEMGAFVLADAKGIKPIIDILISKRSELLHRRAIWAIERLLRTDSIALEIFKNQNVRPVLIEAYQHGDIRTKQIAENALKWLDVIPNFSMIF